MDILSIIILGIGLSMDALAVSICKGLATQKTTIKATLVVGIWFGFFHFLMPLIGYFIGNAFYGIVSAIAPWIAFILLAIIGINMIREARSDEEEEGIDDSLSVKTMLPLTIAVSIDSMAIGVSMAMSGESVFDCTPIFGIIVFTISAAGMMLGGKLGDKFGKHAEFLGGIILFAIGVKVLLEGLGYL